MSNVVGNRPLSGTGGKTEWPLQYVPFGWRHCECQESRPDDSFPGADWNLTMPTAAMKFVTKDEKSEFLRLVRLLSDDVTELSASTSILLSLSRRSTEAKVLSVLNDNADFWNSIFASLYTTSFVVIGRIHDNGKAAYLKKIVSGLTAQKSMADVLANFSIVRTTHSDLIKSALNVRDKVFAHSDFDRPRHMVVGFRGMTWAQLESYWTDIASAAEALERRVFSGTNYGPKFGADILENDIVRANEFFDKLVSTSSKP
jgi:hypothetical protein